jgi:hypothetical protein
MKHIKIEEVKENDFDNIVAKDLIDIEASSKFSVTRVRLKGIQSFSVNKKN